MKDNQIVRTAALFTTMGVYTARVAFVGNGTVDIVIYDINPFALVLIVMVILALPETIDMLPIGPNRTPPTDSKK